MIADHLGDSYDSVKRLWQEVFADWAPLYAEPRFIPSEIHGLYTRITRIPLSDPPASGAFSLFNDPDTGIRLPSGASQPEGRSHITIQTILSQLRERSPRCVVTFDQSFDRQGGNGYERLQRETKLREVHKEGAFGFYYGSHASFMFVFSDKKSCREIRARLLDFGINSRFIQTINESL